VLDPAVLNPNLFRPSVALVPYTPSGGGPAVSTSVSHGASVLDTVSRIVNTVAQAFGKRPLVTSPGGVPVAQGQYVAPGSVAYDPATGQVITPVTPDTPGGLMDAITGGVKKVVIEHPVVSFSIAGFVVYELLRQKKGKR